MFFAYNKTCHGKGCGYSSWWITIKSSLVISLSWHVFLHFADWVSRVCHFFRPGAHASGIFWNLLEIWMPTIKKHNNRRTMRQRTAEGANHWVNSKDRNAPIRAVEKKLIIAEHYAWPVDLIAWRRLAVCSRNVAIYIARDYIVRQTKNLAF